MAIPISILKMMFPVVFFIAFTKVSKFRWMVGIQLFLDSIYLQTCKYFEQVQYLNLDISCPIWDFDKMESMGDYLQVSGFIELSLSMMHSNHSVHQKSFHEQS